MRVAIALDRWKLPTFRRRLTLAGVGYEEGDGPTPDCAMLYVETEDPDGMVALIRRANDEAAAGRNNPSAN